MAGNCMRLALPPSDVWILWSWVPWMLKKLRCKYDPNAPRLREVFTRFFLCQGCMNCMSEWHSDILYENTVIRLSGPLFTGMAIGLATWIFRCWKSARFGGFSHQSLQHQTMQWLIVSFCSIPHIFVYMINYIDIYMPILHMVAWET